MNKNQVTPEVEAVARAIAACDDQDDWIAWEHNQPSTTKVYSKYARAAMTAIETLSTKESDLRADILGNGEDYAVTGDWWCGTEDSEGNTLASLRVENERLREALTEVEHAEHVETARRIASAALQGLAS